MTTRYRTKDQSRGVLITEGVYNAELVGINLYKGRHGNMAALIFKFLDGEYKDGKILRSCDISGERTGAFTSIIEGLTGQAAAPLGFDIEALRGKRCQITVKTTEGSDGKLYSRIESIRQLQHKK